MDDSGLTAVDTGLMRDDTGLTGDDIGLTGDVTGLTGDDTGLMEECSFWLVYNSLSSVLPFPLTFSSLLHSLSLFISTSFSSSTVDE